MISITKSQQDNLIQLQQVGDEITTTIGMLDTIATRVESLELELALYEKKVEDEKKILQEFKRQYRSFESDLQAKQSQIIKSKEKLRSVKTNKEYNSTLKEIDKLKEQNSLLEDEMLNLLDRIDEADKAVLKSQEEYNQTKSDITTRMNAVSLEEQDGKNELARLNKHCSALETKINKDLLIKFKLVKEKITGPSISPVINAVCQGCHLNIPPQMYIELQRIENLKFCPNCQRMIYWVEPQ